MEGVGPGYLKLGGVGAIKKRKKHRIQNWGRGYWVFRMRGGGDPVENVVGRRKTIQNLGEGGYY